MDTNLHPMMDRPFLPHDLIYVPTETGLTFQRAHRVISINGRNAYERFARIAPRLDGRLQLSDIDTVLSPVEAPPMEKLLSILMQKRFLLPYDSDLDNLPTEVRDRFDQQIRFLHHLSPSPAASFLDFREADIRVAGTGEALDATVAALRRNGSERISPLDGVSDCAVADLVLYISETPNLRTVLELSTACRKAQVAFLAAIVIAGNAVIGPFVEPNGAISWEDALLRVLDHQPASVRAGLWRHIAINAAWMADALPSGAPQLQILGNHVAFAAFMALCGVRKYTDRIETIDLETLDTKTATLLPHPERSATVSANLITDIGAVVAKDAVTGFESLGLVGTVCGIFHAFQDDGLLQIPVFRTRLHAHLDVGAGLDTVFVANSFKSNADARSLALAQACCQYAVTVGADRMARPLEHGIARISARALAGTIVRIADRARIGMIEADMRVAAAAGDGARVAVPAAAIHAPVGASPIEPEHVIAGVGCATAIDDARRLADLSLLRFEALKAIALGHADLARTDLLSGASGLLGLYDIAVQQGRILLAGSVGIHNCFVSVIAPSGQLNDPSQIAVGCGFSELEAIREALVEAASLATGGESTLTLERLLPHRLGYQRAGWSFHDAATPASHLLLEEICPGQGGGIAELLHLDITPPDLRRVGLHVCKTLLARIER